MGTEQATTQAPLRARQADGGFKRRPGRGKGRMAALSTLDEVRQILGDAPLARSYLIENLHRLQDHAGFLHEDQLVALAELMKLSVVEVYEVASFYHHFDIYADPAEASALTVRVCDSVSCAMAGADALAARLESAGLGDSVRIQKVPCVGRCAQAPVAVVGQHPVEQADEARVRECVEAGRTGAGLPDEAKDMAAYRAEGGYALYDRLCAGEVSADQIVAALSDSGLRGLGGAGFPAGRKWSILREQPAPRLIAVNLDEGEPGTFKDRHYLEQDPHRMLEGLLIAARVIEADACYIYLRDEYPHLQALLTQSLQALRAAYPDAPPIELRRGAGAYICGEESAMIESIEGKRGLPRLRPPFVAQRGLFDRPTLAHNGETLYWVREIVERGPDWFASQGRHGRKGLRSFSVSGRVREPGVKLAPAGITLRELIDEYCGGMLPGHDLYAYFPGGASGGILPERLADVPLDFDTLQPYGCFIGSAAIIVLSQHDSAREAALNAMRFFEHESCGQCTPCRVGTAKAAALMAEARWDVEKLKDLAQVMTDASICGLGQAAPNPLMCVLKYFPEELEA